VKREDNAYEYCSIFRHGLGVPDLERSLVMAGESREEYYAQIEGLKGHELSGLHIRIEEDSVPTPFGPGWARSPFQGQRPGQPRPFNSVS
jgi:hypothetical protein